MAKEPEGFTVVERPGVNPKPSVDSPTAYDPQGGGDHYCDPDEYNEQDKNWRGVGKARS